MTRQGPPGTVFSLSNLNWSVHYVLVAWLTQGFEDSQTPSLTHCTVSLDLTIMPLVIKIWIFYAFGHITKLDSIWVEIGIFRVYDILVKSQPTKQ